MSRESRHLVIDRISLEGLAFSPHEQDAFRRQLSAELERLLAEEWAGGLENRRQDQVQAPPLEMASHAQPAGMAAQVASRIVDAVKG